MRRYLRPVLGGFAALLLVLTALIVVRWDDRDVAPLPSVWTPLTPTVDRMPPGPTIRPTPDRT